MSVIEKKNILSQTMEGENESDLKEESTPEIEHDNKGYASSGSGSNLDKNIPINLVNHMNAEIRRRKKQSEDGQIDSESDDLVKEDVSRLKPSAPPLLANGDPDNDMTDDKTVVAPDDGDYQRPAKLDLKEESTPEIEHDNKGYASSGSSSNLNKNIPINLVNQMNAEIRRRKKQSEAGQIDSESDDFVKEDVSHLKPSATPLLENGDPDNDMTDDKTVVAPDDGDYQRPAKLDLLVGFLRLMNFLSAVAAVLGIVVSIYIPALAGKMGVSQVWATFSRDQQRVLLDKSELGEPVRAAAGSIQLGFMLIISALVTIDSVATMTFRWKDYGELTHRHTDATSVLFLLSKSRWHMRFLSALTIASTVSLRTSQIIMTSFKNDLENKYQEGRLLIGPKEQSDQAIHAVVWYLSITGAGLVSCILGYLLYKLGKLMRLMPCCSTWGDVPWLDNHVTETHVDDVGDKWKSSRELIIERLRVAMAIVEISVPAEYNKEDLYYVTYYKKFTMFGHIVEIINKVLYFTCYIVAIAMNLRALLIIDINIFDVDFWTCILSATCCIIISLYLLIIISIQCFRRPPKRTPFLSRIYIPFVMSSGFRLLMDTMGNMPGKDTAMYVYLSLMMLFVFMQFFSLFTMSCSFKQSVDACFCKFLCFNFYQSEGAYKKCVRLFDSLGSFFALFGLVIGLSSMFIDQYDLDFEPLGELKTVADALTEFKNGIYLVAAAIKKIIKVFDFNVTCEAIYSTIATGSIATIFLSFVPGASSAASIGSKSAYYSVKVGSALTRLAKALKNSAKIPWKVMKTIRTLQKFTFKNFSKFTIAGSSPSLIRMMTFIPPVVIGIYVLFSAFWPKRVLFYSTKQRRMFNNNQFMKWLLAFICLILALAINTALVDELIRVFDEALPLVKVSVNKKLGWKLSLAASAFAVAASVSFIICYLILMIKTDKDHENITNSEKEWQKILEERQLVKFKTALGDKIEHKNQVRYKKERIGPWTWVLPILLCLIACGFGVLANLYPKIDMYREPKGALGRLMDKMLVKFSFYEDDMKRINEYGERECLPYATLNDVLSQSMYKRSNILMNPIYAFFNQTEKIMRPLKDVVSRTRKQLISDIGDDLFGQDVKKTLKTLKRLDLQYLGMLLLIPRVMNLCILIFGMFAASIAICQMRIIDAIEPRKIVDAFGKICIFSVIYVLGAQLSIFNVLSEFGIPFYQITTRLGLGFIYDLVCDSIMVSIYIGMKNEFFFAIPKRKVTVTYSIPGVSDAPGGPPGQIV